jgi:hypothetical protein
MSKRSAFVFFLNLFCHVQFVSAFVPVISNTQNHQKLVVYAAESINDPDSSESISPPPSFEEYAKAREEGGVADDPAQVVAAAASAAPPTSIPQQPPTPPPRRLDPLMAR